MGFYVYILLKSGKEIDTFSTKQKAKEYAQECEDNYDPEDY